jgi:ribosome-binding protein aMBF1 (putative translation factor)
MPKRQAKDRVSRKPARAFVSVPAEEYEMLVARAALRETAWVLESDRDEDWVDADEALEALRRSRIADLRRQRGLTQRQLSSKAGMPQSQLCRIERNPESTTLRQLRRIAQALGVPTAELV